MSKRKKKKVKLSTHNVTKRLQMELQATIVFDYYDSHEVLQKDDSVNRSALRKLLRKLYLPPNDDNDKCISSVGIFLQGRGRFKAIFSLLGMRIRPKSIKT